MNEMKYKSYTIYIEESQKQIEKTIASYVKKKALMKKGMTKKGMIDVVITGMVLIEKVMIQMVLTV